MSTQQQYEIVNSVRKIGILKSGVVSLLVVLVLISGVLTGSLKTVFAAAGSPWKWEMVLKRDILQDSMNMPTSLYVDEIKEQYYVVDSGNNRILSFNRSGELLNIFNAGKSLKIPFDMTRTDDGAIWVVEKGRNSLTRIDLKTREVVPSTLYYDGEIIYPERLEYDQDRFFVLDKGTGDIISYSRDLVQQKRYSCDGCLVGFTDFKIVKGELWALDIYEKSISRFSMSGTLMGKVDLGDTVSLPYSFSVGPAGYIYVVDRQKRKIAVYDKDGKYKYNFLRFGFARSEMYYPIEIRFDPWGGFCVVDEGNARVEVFRR